MAAASAGPPIFPCSWQYLLGTMLMSDTMLGESKTKFPPPDGQAMAIAGTFLSCLSVWSDRGVLGISCCCWFLSHPLQRAQPIQRPRK